MHLFSADPQLARHSYCADSALRAVQYPVLQEDADCDVAILGGGLAGLSAAIELADGGHSVRPLEARKVGFGASGRNGGQAIHGLACDQGEIEPQLGLAAGAWINSPRHHATVHDPRPGRLHPLKYTLGLARAASGLGVLIHEGTAVTALTAGKRSADRPVLHTTTGRITARQVLLAGNVYLQGLAPKLAARIMPEGTYIVASEPVGEALARRLIPCNAAVCDNNFVLDYFRFSADWRLLYGGRVSYSTATPMNLADRMRQRMAETFPLLADTPVSHAWAGFVDITMNRAADFCRLPDASGLLRARLFGPRPGAYRPGRPPRGRGHGR